MHKNAMLFHFLHKLIFYLEKLIPYFLIRSGLYKGLEFICFKGYECSNVFVFGPFKMQKIGRYIFLEIPYLLDKNY